MNSLEFDHEMAIMVSEFKAFMKPARMGLIWNFVQDLTAVQLRRINAHFLATMKTAPLPVNYKEAVQRERNARPNISQEPAPIYIPACKTCLDVGVVTVKKNGDMTFAKCGRIDHNGKRCKFADIQPWKLPFADEISGYEVSPVPWEAFKPKIMRRNDPRDHKEAKVFEAQAMRAINEKAKWWRETIRIAERGWGMA